MTKQDLIESLVAHIEGMDGVKSVEYEDVDDSITIRTHMHDMFVLDVKEVR